MFWKRFFSKKHDLFSLLFKKHGFSNDWSGGGCVEMSNNERGYDCHWLSLGRTPYFRIGIPFGG